MEIVQAWVASSGHQKIHSVVSSKTIASRAWAPLHTSTEAITRDSLKTTKDMALAKVNGQMVLITLVFGSTGRKMDSESGFQHRDKFKMGFGGKENGFVTMKKANSLSESIIKNKIIIRKEQATCRRELRQQN